MSKRDYYDVLGVPKGSEQDAIKKAYRTKAKELHPDRNSDNPNAEAQFKLDSRTLQSRSVLFDPLISGIKKEIGQITNKDLSEKEAVLKALQLEFQL